MDESPRGHLGLVNHHPVEPVVPLAELHGGQGQPVEQVHHHPVEDGQGLLGDLHVGLHDGEDPLEGQDEDGAGAAEGGGLGFGLCLLLVDPGRGGGAGLEPPGVATTVSVSSKIPISVHWHG